MDKNFFFSDFVSMQEAGRLRINLTDAAATLRIEYAQYPLGQEYQDGRNVLVYESIVLVTVRDATGQVIEQADYARHAVTRVDVQDADAEVRIHNATAIPVSTVSARRAAMAVA
jgi:hypothetical protein